MMIHRPVGALLLATLTLTTSSVFAENSRVLYDKTNADHEGLTVLRVWGSHQQIGFAIGAAFPKEIAQSCKEARSMAGSQYDTLRGYMSHATWMPTGINDEFAGIAQGVKSVLPTANVDTVDIQIINTFSDWGYAPSCRSHAAWGSWTKPPFKTLATRRLDFPSPFSTLHHHVIYAIAPTDGSVRWVNVAWPGIVSVVTGVNQVGTLVSLHDYHSTLALTPGVIPRSVASRNILSSAPNTPIAQHLSWARQQLALAPIATGTFINYFVPEGHGAVFTCSSGGGCGAGRTAQSDFLDGSVLITTNSQTTGHSYPSGAAFLKPYYGDKTPKTPESHFDVMKAHELHLLTVAYRGEQDMRLLFRGRITNGYTPRYDTEWTTLFNDATDGGTPEPDASTLDAAGQDATQEADTPPEDSSATTHDSGETHPDSGMDDAQVPADWATDDSSADGCQCSTQRGPANGSWWLTALASLAMTALLRRKRR